MTFSYHNYDISGHNDDLFLY